ncbi:DUF6412 domain-containing protein [Micromonospora sp. PLK6-60]|uniref:DUF6412 domain-containing protein n=1 Tax=Micromonospora sp. PLK6-60 TaxID=2873383 RepID=UPI001CA7B57F|nr:DUF6412 domain-containing protein [Micromonospora sp. PLK6-60]MBY8873443.1 DUF6412 domain-containing protein [Micromonospora sp. PLK6-60]
MPGTLSVVTSLWAYALTGLTLLADRPGDLLAGAAMVAALLLTALLAARPRAPRGPARVGRAAGVRDRARRRGVPRQVDPDAAGRPRPRAPGHRPSVGWRPVAF